MTEITITLTHDPQRLNDLQPQWVALQADSASDGIYMTWEWVSAWWQFFGSEHELWLITAESSDGLIGVAPLMLVSNHPAPGITWRELQFIAATAACEHLDFLIATGQEAAVLPRFIDVLKSHRKRWDVLRLERILPTSPNLALLEKMDIPWEEGEPLVAPYISLPERWDDYFKSLSKNKREKQRRFIHHLDKAYPDNWQFDWVREKEQLAPVLDRLIELHQKKWEEQGQPGAFPDKVARQFFHAIVQRFLEKGWMRLYRLNFGEDQVASLLAYLYRERLYYFATGIDYAFSDLNPGHILVELSIKEVLEAGASEYDFLWGNESYKYSWGGQDRTDRGLVWFAATRAKMEKRMIAVARVVYRSLKRFKKILFR